MSTEKKTGGPAFPTQGYDHGAAMNGIGVTVTDQEGMSLRDYFAARAMQGLIAQSDGAALHSDPEIGALYAYRMADAMLAARENSND